MNYITLLLSALLLTSFTAQSQELIPKTGNIVHHDKSRMCLVVILDPEPKTLKKAWKDYLKDNHDVKLDGIGFLANKDMLSEEEVVIKAISSKKMNIYTQVLAADDNGSQMKVFGSFGYDIYINQKNYPTEYASLRNIVESFIKEYIPKYYTEIIKDTEDKVKDLRKEDEKLEKDIKKAKKDIQELNKDIKEKQEALITNEERLTITKSQLGSQQAKLNQIKAKLRKL